MPPEVLASKHNGICKWLETVFVAVSGLKVTKVVMELQKQKAPRLGFDKTMLNLIFLAGAAGFEPATYGFGDRRSTS